MRKKIYTVWIILLLIHRMSVSVLAADDKKSFLFDLTVDGKSTVEVKTGDIITVVLKLYRTDSSEKYTMYAMQDEIRFDNTFFELIKDSTVLSAGVVSTNVIVEERYQEVYMNYLSMSGGTQWDSETLIGSVQLRVIGESGVTHITNEDSLVSLSDGSGSYLCETKDITVILSTECEVSFMTSGGNEIPVQIVQYGEKIKRPADPLREGFSFKGWYTDINLKKEWDFDNDIVRENMSLYAKWEAEQTEESVLAENTENPGGFCWIWMLLLVILLYLLYRKYKSEKKKQRE